MYACGRAEVRADRAQEHFVLPEVLAQVRSRFDEALMEALLTIQAATAMEAGFVSPAHVVVDTFPSEQGSQRVTDATTLERAKKKSSRLSRTLPTRPPQEPQPCRGRLANSTTTSRSSCGASADSAEAKATCV